MTLAPELERLSVQDQQEVQRLYVQYCQHFWAREQLKEQQKPVNAVLLCCLVALATLVSYPQRELAGGALIAAAICGLLAYQARKRVLAESVRMWKCEGVLRKHGFFFTSGYHGRPELTCATSFQAVPVRLEWSARANSR